MKRVPERGRRSINSNQRASSSGSSDIDTNPLQIYFVADKISAQPVTNRPRICLFYFDKFWWKIHYLMSNNSNYLTSFFISERPSNDITIGCENMSNDSPNDSPNDTERHMEYNDFLDKWTQAGSYVYLIELITYENHLGLVRYFIANTSASTHKIPDSLFHARHPRAAQPPQPPQPPQPLQPPQPPQPQWLYWVCPALTAVIGKTNLQVITKDYKNQQWYALIPAKGEIVQYRSLRDV